MKLNSSEKIIIASFITLFIISFAIALSASLWIGLYALLCYFVDYQFTWGKAFAFWGIGAIMFSLFNTMIKK